VDRIHFDPFAGAFPAPLAPAGGSARTEANNGAAPGQTPAPAQFRPAVAAYERRLLTRALEAAGGNRRAAAESLDLSYDQLRGLLRKYRLGGRSRARS
jgi:psp operon transcriptional activator